MLLALMAVALVFLAECGKDEPTSSQLAVGDTTDPGFQMIQGIVGEGQFDFGEQILGISFELLEDYFGMGAPAKISGGADASQEITIGYAHDSSDYWHIFACTVTVIEAEESFQITGIDSIRLATAEGYTYVFDTSVVNAVDVKGHFTVDLEMIEGYGHMGAHGGFEIDGLYGEEVTVNGLSNDTAMMAISGDSGTCEMDLTFGQSFANIVIIPQPYSDTGECPSSGVITTNATLDIACTGSTALDSLNISGAWHVVAVFNGDGTVTITYEDGTTRWVVTEECGDGGTPAKSGLASRLKALGELRK
jgi:hypothetical protein